MKGFDISARYRALCARTNELSRSTGEFYTSLSQRGFTRCKKRSGIFVQGLKLAENESDF